MQEILTLVAAGRGVCLVPKTVTELYPRADVSYVQPGDHGLVSGFANWHEVEP